MVSFLGTIYDQTVEIDDQEWMDLGKKGFLLKGELRRGNIFYFISSFVCLTSYFLCVEYKVCVQ